MNMDYQEGYSDGIAGAGLQDRCCACPDQTSAAWYEHGFIMGSSDRKAMLEPDAFALWAGDLMHTMHTDTQG